MWLTIIFFAVIALMIFINVKTGVNLGLMAFGAGLIIAACVDGTSANAALIAGFPLRNFLNMFFATMFFGYANETGVMKGVAQRLMYAFRNHAALIPYVGFVVSFIISAAGGGVAVTPYIMSPMMFSLAIQLGFHPVLASFATWMCAWGAYCVPWQFMWQYNIAMYTEVFGEENIAAITTGWIKFNVWGIITALIVFTAFYFISGAHKISAKTVNIEVPEPFTQKQSITLKVLVGAIIVMVVPPVINTIAPNAVCDWISSYIGLQVVCIVGTLILCFLKIAPLGDVLSNQVPWNLLVTLTGMVFYISMADKMGVIDTIIVPIQALPISTKWLIIILAMAYAVLCYFADGSAIEPMLFPLYAVFVTMGATIPQVITTFGLAAMSVSISPYSGGGGSSLTGCPDSLMNKCMRTQMMLPIANIVLLFVFSAVGLF